MKLFLIFFTSFLIVSSLNAQKILFDNTKSEEAGNADRIIDNTEPVPYPEQSGINQFTDESYWVGAISA